MTKLSRFFFPLNFANAPTDIANKITTWQQLARFLQLPTHVHIWLRFCQLLPVPLSSLRKRKMKYSLLPQQNGNKSLAVMTMTPSVGENPYTLDHEIQFPFISLQKSFETASYCTCHYVTMTTHKPLWFHETLLCTRVILRGTQVFKEVIIPPITASDSPKVFPVKKINFPPSLLRSRLHTDSSSATGTLFYPTIRNALYSDHFTWRLAVLRSPPCQFTASGTPNGLAGSTTAILDLYSSHLKQTSVVSNVVQWMSKF